MKYGFVLTSSTNSAKLSMSVSVCLGFVFNFEVESVILLISFEGAGQTARPEAVNCSSRRFIAVKNTNYKYKAIKI